MKKLFIAFVLLQIACIIIPTVVGILFGNYEILITVLLTSLINIIISILLYIFLKDVVPYYVANVWLLDLFKYRLIRLSNSEWFYIYNDVYTIQIDNGKVILKERGYVKHTLEFNPQDKVYKDLIDGYNTRKTIYDLFTNHITNK